MSNKILLVAVALLAIAVFVQTCRLSSVQTANEKSTKGLECVKKCVQF